MAQSVLVFLSLLSSFSFAASGLEGREASLTIEIKALSKINGVLWANGTIKKSEFATGIYFEPKNKFVDLEVSDSCHSIVEIAFSQQLKFSVRGELRKFEERFTSPNQVTFNEKKSIQCVVVRSKE
jgi:hypothetical protein